MEESRRSPVNRPYGIKIEGFGSSANSRSGMGGPHFANDKDTRVPRTEGNAYNNSWRIAVFLNEGD